MALKRLVLAAACLAGAAELAGAAPAITGTISQGPTPAAISGAGLSRVTASYMISGIVDYTDGNGQDIGAGIAASLVAQGAQVNASQVSIKDSSFAVAGTITLISASPPTVVPQLCARSFGCCASSAPAVTGQ